MIGAQAGGAGRYHRQEILPRIGAAGQARLRSSSAVVVGCGALGCVSADLLARAGVGRLTVIDRDVVEETNLQRQTLYGEADVGSPKAPAAAARLRAVNSSIEVRAEAADFSWRNARGLLEGAGVILDGTDNFAARYLLNDAAVSAGIPFVYAGAVGVEAMTMTVLPGETACLRCLFEEPPAPGSAAATATCDTVGVLNAAPVVAAALQAAAALRVLVETGPARSEGSLVHLDVWDRRWRRVDAATAAARRPGCPCCDKRLFPFLSGERGGGAAVLCGRDAVQVWPEGAGRIDLGALAARLGAHGDFEATRFLVRGRLRSGGGAEPGVTLTVFPDGRAIIGGVESEARARAVYDRFIGG